MVGDIVNVLMVAAANNFKRAMKALCCMYGHENEMYNVGVSLKEVECL